MMVDERDNSNQIDAFTSSLKEIVRKINLSLENFTEDQFVEVLRQAILSGDFQRLTTPSYFVPMGVKVDEVSNPYSLVMKLNQSVTYIPFREKAKLTSDLMKASHCLDIAVTALEDIRNFERETDRGTYFTTNFINPALENMEKIAESIEYDD